MGFNSYTNDQSSRLWRGDFFSAVGAFFLGSKFFFINTIIVPREDIIINLFLLYPYVIILPGRDYKSYTNHQSSSLWRGDFFLSPRGFFTRNYIIFHQHQYRAMKVSYFNLTSYHRKTLNNRRKLQSPNTY